MTLAVGVLIGVVVAQIVWGLRARARVPPPVRRPMTRADLDALAEEREEPLLCADGFDACILGIGRQFTKTFVVYDYEAVIQTLMDRDGLAYDEAVEMFDVNIVGAYLGEATPCFLARTP
jgi:hypothetical protein